MVKLDLNSGQLKKGTEVTSREVINVLVLLQISLGGLYVAIASLGLIALRKVSKHPELKIDVPQKEILQMSLGEGFVMIINGYLTRVSSKNRWLGLLAFTMVVNLAIANFNSYELAYRFINRLDYESEIHGIILLWILELIFYFIILYYSTRIFVTLQAKRGRASAKEDAKEDAKEEAKKQQVLPFVGSQESINLVLGVRRSHSSTSINQLTTREQPPKPIDQPLPGRVESVIEPAKSSPRNQGKEI